jgi:tetratricopeptide (TPR) repeat protein
MAGFGRFFLGTALTCVAAPLWASAEPVYRPADAWVAEPDRPLPTTAASAKLPLLLFDQQVKLGPGERALFVQQAVRIQSPEMLTALGTINLVWHPDRDDIIIHRLHIVRDGAVIDLWEQGARPTIIRRERQLESASLDGYLTGTIAITDLRVGDILRYATTTIQREVVLPDAAAGEVRLFAAPQRLGAGTARMLWPTAMPVKWKAVGNGITPTITESGGMTSLSLTLPVVKQTEMPGDAPPRFQRPPMIEASSVASWADLSRLVAPLYADTAKYAADGPLAAEVKKIAAQTKDPRTRAYLALKLVQSQVRYLYRGMENGNYVPQTPDVTWAARYGDCKAKTLLLLAILRELDIEADAALVHSQLGDALPDRLPALGAFDHVLVRAVVDGQTLWLDGTSANAHPDDLGNVPPFSFALPLTAAGRDLEPMPLVKPSRPQMRINLALDQSAGTFAPPLFDLRVEFSGPMAGQVAVMKANANDDQFRDYAAQMVSQMTENGLSYEREIIVDEAAGTATLTAKGVGNFSWTRRDGLPVRELDSGKESLLLETDRARAAWRDIPVATSIPLAVESKLSIVLPKGRGAFRLEGGPAGIFAVGSATLEWQATLDAGVAKSAQFLYPTAHELPAADLPAARAKLAEFEKRAIQLRAPAGYPERYREIADAKKANRLGPWHAVYQKIIDDQPDEANSYTNRANFLRGIYDYKGAIADLDRAIALENSVDTLFDRSGLHRALGNDAAALADIDAALELDPGLEGGKGSKADLLADMSEFDAALAIVTEEEVTAQKGDWGWTALRADILGKAGRADEGIVLLDAAISESPNDAMLLNGRCWLKGQFEIDLAGALKDCTRAVEQSENAAAILDSRALVHFRMGSMDAARADWDSALELSPGMPAALFMRGILRMQSGDRAGGQADIADARMQRPRIDKDYAVIGIKAE